MQLEQTRTLEKIGLLSPIKASKGSYSFTENILRKITGSIESGGITFVLPDSRKVECGSGVEGPQAVIKLHSFKTLQRLVSSGYLGLAEGYIHKEWSSPSLRNVFDFGAANMEALDQNLSGNKFVRVSNKVIKFLKRNNKSGSKKNISAHYDLGNNFFAEWLDHTMTYSSGIYEAEVSTELASAQEAKYRRIIEKLDIQSHHSVLEIGCGWGGFAEFAARETGAQITGLTISKEQHDFAVDRITNAGLQQKVDIQLKDYRDITGTYDRIVSIEMLEAVGQEFWPTYFDTVSKSMVKDGEAMIQVITIPDDRFDQYCESVDFIQRYIFPGGMLPSPEKMSEHSAASGLGLTDAFMFGPSYSRTLDSWQESFQKKWAAIKPHGFDDRFKRVWEYYLDYTSAGFRAGTIDVGQFHLKKH